MNKYDSISEYCGRAAVVSKNNKKGCIDINGKEIIPCVYDTCEVFQGRFIAFSKDKKWGFANMHGGIIVQPISQIPVWLDYDNKGVLSINGDKGLVDATGNYLISPDRQYEFIGDYNNNESIAIVKKNGLYGLIKYSKCGIVYIIIPCIYKKLYQRFNNDLLLAITTDQKYEFINNHGDIVLSLNNYDNCEPFSDGLSKVTKKSHVGYINEKGEEIIPCMFTDGSNFSNGIAKVRNNENKWGIINKNGYMITHYEYDSDKSMKIIRKETNDSNKTNYICVFQNNKCGLINNNGEEIIPIEHDSIDILDDIAIIWDKDENNELKYIFYSLSTKAVIKMNNFISTDFNGNTIVRYADQTYENILIKDKLFYTLDDFIYYNYDELYRTKYMYEYYHNMSIVYNTLTDKKSSSMFK